jgi:hypothetical protein
VGLPGGQAAVLGLSPFLPVRPPCVRLDTRYRPPRGGRQRVFCAYFDPDAGRVVLRARLVAQLPAEALPPLVAQTCAHAVLWRRGEDWESGAAADALARSWGFDLAPLDEWSGYPDEWRAGQENGGRGRGSA